MVCGTLSGMESPRSKAALLTAVGQGATFTYLPFYGHAPEPDGSVGPGCLSQWWPAPFSVDGNTFATAEHYMMWRKATLFNDPETAGRILAAATPKEAKALGRQARNFDQAVWEATRYEIVVAAGTHKFGQHDDLREFLLSTGDQVLVEASPRDRVWGIGLGRNNPAAHDPTLWRGLNLLGFALGEVRSAATRS
ncbi:hypothetical protein CLV71_110250 [Actinophytocola oryzae]|uniref:NADAR domain-containing protein n=2 Tax=Actinophytocola oryzae TaxID=502181 RepID=A0A4R7VDF3_9PSEU|nr:hypothetical protein CLV71_110250 [Actinophytocola oryzae]